jgi:hypothetical protein
MYRQPLDLPQISRRTAPSDLGDLFFMPAAAIPETTLRDVFFINFNHRGAEGAEKKEKNKASDHYFSRSISGAGIFLYMLFSVSLRLCGSPFFLEAVCSNCPV